MYQHGLSTVNAGSVGAPYRSQETSSQSLALLLRQSSNSHNFDIGPMGLHKQRDLTSFLPDAGLRDMKGGEKGRGGGVWRGVWRGAAWLQRKVTFDFASKTLIMLHLQDMTRCGACINFGCCLQVLKTQVCFTACACVHGEKAAGTAAMYARKVSPCHMCHRPDKCNSISWHSMST